MRLRSIRYKDGRAPILVLNTPMPNVGENGPENFRGRMIEHAKQIGGHESPGSAIDGFVVIGMFSDGTTSIGYRIPNRIPQCLVSGYVTELMRRDVVVGNEAARVFDDKFQWVEG